MYDTATRVALVKKRALAGWRRKQRRVVGELSALCVTLFAALAAVTGAVTGQAQADGQGMFGAMLLREDADGYVLVGVVSFAAAVVVTVLCIRLRDRGRREKKGAGNTAPQEQEGKTA